MIKLAYNYPKQDVIEDLAVLREGDLIQIIKFAPAQTQPNQEQFYLPGQKPTILIAKNVVVSHVAGNVIYGWVGTGANITRDESFDKALAKYEQYLQNDLPNPINVITYNPVNYRILRVGNAQDLLAEKLLPKTVEPWFGLGQKAGIWTPITKSSNPTVNEALKPIELNGTPIFKELKFHYVRKLKRHYPAPNTSTDRVVRPHFMYKISSKPGNEYLLARDYLNARGEWRTFLIVDRGVMRIQNAQLGEAFRFNVNQTMLYTKQGMKNVASRILKDSVDKEDYMNRKKEHNLYNSMKLYYKHLKKMLKDTKKPVKECKTYSKYITYGDIIDVDYINGRSTTYTFSHWANNKLYGWYSNNIKSSSIAIELADVSEIRNIEVLGTIFSNNKLKFEFDK